ncbi:MAG: hypothetical protein ACLFR1_14825 [Spirochaetia bacterium]
MKKFIISLFILLIFGSVVFYFGWVQFRLSEDTYAVVFTKTSGFEARPIAPGEFQWRWEALLPTNLTLHKFHIEPVRVNISHTGELPSANVYSDLIAEQGAFSLRIDLVIDYVINPDHLADLVIEGYLREESMDQWYSTMENAITTYAVEHLTREAPQTQVTGNNLSELVPGLESALASEFPELSFISIVPDRVELPDFGLYQEVRDRYSAIMNEREELYVENMRRAISEETQQTTRIEALERYGQILSDYPVLLDYFSMGIEQGVDPLRLEELGLNLEE